MIAALVLPGCRDAGGKGVGGGVGTGTGSGTAVPFQPVVPGAVGTDAGPAEMGFAGFLTGGDVAPSGAEVPLAGEDLADLINGYRDVFFLRNPQQRFDASDCNDASFDTASFEATRTAAVFQVDTADFSGCLNSVPPKDPQISIRYSRAHIKHFDKSTCDGVDLSILNGKPPSQITDSDVAVCDRASSANSLRNTLLDYEFTVSTPKGSVAVTANSMVSAMTPDGRACRGVQGNGGTWTYEPCRYVVRTVYTFAAEAGDAGVIKNQYRSLYLKADTQDLNGVPPNQFYDSGRMAIMLNDWTGELTYNGATQPPAWNLMRGSGADSARGVFSGIQNQ